MVEGKGIRVGVFGLLRGILVGIFNGSTFIGGKDKGATTGGVARLPGNVYRVISFYDLCVFFLSLSVCLPFLSFV